MLNENFWIFLSFVCFVLLGYKFIKQSVISTLDTKIKSVDELILNAQSAKKDSEEKLSSLNQEYENILAKYNLIVEEAIVEAAQILKQTEEKVKILDQQMITHFDEYKNQSEKVMIDKLKGDILMTVLKLIENDYKGKQSHQLQSIEDNIDFIKKMWN